MRGIDSHVHIFEPQRFPFAAGVAYEPPAGECGDAAALLRVLAAHGLDRALLVNPIAGYSYDSSCMLDALQHHSQAFRGVALARPDMSDSELDRLGEAGVVGARLDLIGLGAALVREAESSGLFRRLAARDWFVELQCERDQLAEVGGALARAGVRIVVEHCGRPDPSLGTGQPGFRALLELGRSGRAAVKLSGPFRFSHAAYPYADVDPFVSALLDAFTPEACVWGSDWPFLRSPERLDYGPGLALLERWVPDRSTRRTILVDAPARIFAFNR